MLLFCSECADHFRLAADLTIMCNRFQKYTFCPSIHRRRVFRSFHLADVFMDIHFLRWKVWVWPCAISWPSERPDMKVHFYTAVGESWEGLWLYSRTPWSPEVVWLDMAQPLGLCVVGKRAEANYTAVPGCASVLLANKRKCLAQHTPSSAQFLQSIMEIVWWAITNHTRLSPIHAGLEFERVEIPGHCIS